MRKACGRPRTGRCERGLKPATYCDNVSDLTNAQFPMLNSHPKGEAAAGVRASGEHSAIRHPLRMRIEHWELNIGQIPGRIHGSGFCQVIFARALSPQSEIRN